MSDGGEAEGRRDEHNNSIIRSGASNYGRAISRIAVAQVCESIGFEGFDESALDSLADIVIRYLCDLGKTSKFYANLAGRTECNVFDVAQGLEDLGMPQGFPGASEIHTDCVVSSGAVREIKEYVETAEEIPFAQPVQRFPVIRERKLIPSFLQMGETPSSKHIPAWLPAFPDPHTYVRTPVWNERVSDPRTDKIELARQHRKAERSLLLAAAAVVLEREMFHQLVCLKSFLVRHTENHVSLLETFAPAIEAMKDGLDSGSDGEKIIPEKRSSVFLEFKRGKKVFGEPLDLRIRNKDPGRTGSWFGREDEKDDKKRRVEFILRQSMENQQELPQL
ncbi:hypothetical protein DH2020_040055 [Rehmannia glutinosa]|uniref:Transcription initiation factor TFIID subunit 8 n=1 Tax=Rehmannia glutinosa TaxID=99300 RepID=A0ABR0UU94_REHGL